MQKRKNKITYAERLSFRDGDLLNPKHDDIMIWLNNNLIDIMGNLVDVPIIPENGIDVCKLNLQKYIDKSISIPFDYKDKFYHRMVLKNNYWEYPIKNKDYIVGYIDMAVRTQTYCFVAKTKAPNYDKFIVEPSLWDSSSFMFEIKTKIPSIGELIRQINTYKQYIDAKYYVVAPKNDRVSDILKQQNIGFIEYQEKPDA